MLRLVEAFGKPNLVLALIRPNLAVFARLITFVCPLNVIWLEVKSRYSINDFLLLLYEIA